MGRPTSTAATNHIRAWRMYAGLNQRQLADLCQTTDGVISSLESGKRRLSEEWLVKLASALKTRPGFLLEFSPMDDDLDLIAALDDIPADRKGEALAMLKILSTGTRG